MKEDAIARVMEETDGKGAEMAFQCTGSPKAASTIWKYVRRGGSMCELGFFVDNGDAAYNPHQDICNKEIKVVGSWTYQAEDWLHAIEMLKEANQRWVSWFPTNSAWMTSMRPWRPTSAWMALRLPL